MDPSSQGAHFEIIRIAVGYCLLGVFAVTATICVLSLIHVKKTEKTPPRALITIEPAWVRKALYSALFVQLFAGPILFWKNLLSISTATTSQSIQSKIEAAGSATADAEIGNLGIVKYWRHSNDFLPHIRESMKNAKREILVSGASFYLSVPGSENEIIDRAMQGVHVKYMFLDPFGTNLAAVAKTFAQPESELRQECIITIKALLRIKKKLPQNKQDNLEVRLFNESPRARFYIIDPDDESSNTYFVPHANATNSPALPGFLLSNKKYGLAQVYISSVKDFWKEAVPYSNWAKRHPEFSL
jgi:hypothetical protein